MIYEVCVFWEGDFFSHECLTLNDAMETANAYRRPADEKCMVRIWTKRYPTE